MALHIPDTATKEEKAAARKEERIAQRRNHRKEADATQTVLAMGCHHKTGTHLLKQIQHAWGDVLGPTRAITSKQRHDTSAWSGYHSRRYQCLDATAFSLMKDFSPYKLVHVIRDPIDTVISGYWYHLHSEDTQLVPNTGPFILEGLTLEEGLAHEARAQIESTLKEMHATVLATQGDDKVLTISLEDFVDDFKMTTALMFDFLVGVDEPNFIKRPQMLERGNSCDKNSNPDIPNTESKHINTEDNYLKSMEVISKSDDAIWDEVRSYREKLGFIELIPGRYRVSHSFQENFAFLEKKRWALDSTKAKHNFALAENMLGEDDDSDGEIVQIEDNE